MKFIVLLILISVNLHANQLRFHNLEQQTQKTTNRVKAITQDDLGFIWIGSVDQLYRFDGFELKSFNKTLRNITGSTPSEINHLNVDSDNSIWISTKNNGLFNFNGLNSKHFNIHQLSDKKTTNYISQSLKLKDGLWLATQGGVTQLNENFEVNHYPFPTHLDGFEQKITSLINLNTEEIMLSTKNQILIFNTSTKNYSLAFEELNSNFYIYRIFRDSAGFVWINSENGLFKIENNKLINVELNLGNIRVSGIAEENDYYWLTTLGQGLVRVKKDDFSVKQYLPEQGNHYSVTESYFNTIYKDNNGLLWLGGFNGSVTYFDTKSLQFGLHNKLSYDSGCMTSDSIFDIIPLSDESSIIKTSNEIIKINHNTNLCEKIIFTADNKRDHKNNKALKIIQGQNSMWLFSKSGIAKLNNEMIPSPLISKQYVTVYYADEIDNSIYIGTNTGLENYDLASGVYIKYKSKSPAIENAKFYSSVLLNNYERVFSTSSGLVVLNQDDLLVSYNNFSDKFPNIDTLSLHADYQGNIWVGTYKNGILKLNQDGDLVKHHDSINGKSGFSGYSMTGDNQGNIWIGSDVGLLNFDLSKNQFFNYSKEDGLQGDFFNINSAITSPSGFVYMGGRNGLNIFDPNKITSKQAVAPPKLTTFKMFNEEVDYSEPSNKFTSNKPIERLKNLTFTHEDYVFSVVFSALNFINPQGIEYAYQLEGFDANWNYTSHSNRQATYTSLPSGEFELKYKAKTLGQEWNDTYDSIHIKVLPPPWLTWWAISSYILLALFSMYWYIQRKIKTNQTIADRLRIDVAEKTKELNIQKQTVENLLVKKNELFSNVSHEFRTPLTLILGPIKELINKQIDNEDTRSLKMINRNANRLLSLVEQLLQIARVSDSDQIKTEPQYTQKQLSSLVESFQYLASSKRINLNLVENTQATIDVTDQFIDAVMGNLISNAIKYTQPGGSVKISSITNENRLVLSVKDTGPGLTTEQQQDIFKRFKRLESHDNIEGIGIGLSVVEEIVKVNSGEIQVVSEVGIGSEFIIRVPLSDKEVLKESESINTLVNQLQNESLEATQSPITEISLNENINLNTVLIIEDNHDMREHIVSIVSPHYNCITAENGVKGVAASINDIPDIIISDVMMPEMDGFKVARVIRSDQRTSHIPLMLLTALNDKTNRIKGWRENVDAYMTKPFDRDELLIQLENMLTIRDILKKKAGQQVSSGIDAPSILPKKDQEFVDKLIQVIEENYMNPILNRSKIASKMAVSDRQLQRKIKALIDQNPMDMLREFRLNKSKELLKDGYQVGIVADECGFNSVSYFSQCFKAQFGMTAKRYQQTTK